MDAAERHFLGLGRRGFRRRQQEIELLGPGYERFDRRALLVYAVRAFELVEHLVAHVDARARLVLPQQRDGIGERADDPPIPQMELGSDGDRRRFSHDHA